MAQKYYCNTLSQRRFRYRHPEKSVERMRKWRATISEEKKDEIRAKNRLYKKVNKVKVNARNLVKLRVDSGKMERKPCVVCGEIKSQAHHEDYSKPLDVVWLCSRCHGKIHRRFELEVGFVCN